MSANLTTTATTTPRLKPVAMPLPENERFHRIRLRALYWIAIAIVLAVFVYGFDYYMLAAPDRPFSPKHQFLKPSGPVGLFLGFFAVALFFGLFLYPVRKAWSWLNKLGNSKHWLDIHILMGLTAPFLILLHCTMKFRGIAGMGFWFMFAVSLSGVVGRYLYTQIPRSLNAAELSRKEQEELRSKLAQQLSVQRLLPENDLRNLLRLPSAESIKKLSLGGAIVYMMLLDLALMSRVARLRRRALHGAEYLTTLGGMLRTGHDDLERAIGTAREEASLSKRILFLAHAQRIFHLWHVVHKPFSYTFVILALLHIGVQFMLGYFH
jgi:hypothetical protein